VEAFQNQELPMVTVTPIVATTVSAIVLSFPTSDGSKKEQEWQPPPPQWQPPPPQSSSRMEEISNIY
jgi:hypothetical protein